MSGALELLGETGRSVIKTLGGTGVVLEEIEGDSLEALDRTWAGESFERTEADLSVTF